AQQIAPLQLERPIQFLPNGVCLDEIDPLPACGTFRRSRPELGADPYVLFLARLEYKKGLDYLADAFAFAARRDSRLRLVVAGPEEDREVVSDFHRRIARA